ncbi:hypothetical protein TanjilG_28654 [Lupinus angustifolius]|uniref:Bifunctional inhibitor/plant lipid transfer protein/seed storage helical domain-containing protein n=1 Tax=Lupinus angustifolius TaxID=3871 RepID=A0A4P1RPV8_LUPAN|nr:PREDICTED: 2S albumin-like [Lupinus angustifolius]OIW15455.1 hypothetical protein TanjilG_28654 [Lupinus angustifolius]
MANLTILIALLAALVLVVHTNAYHSSEQSCEKQPQQLRLRHCERYIIQRVYQQPEDEEEDEDHVQIHRGINHVIRHTRSGEESEESQELEQCCDQLNGLNKRCQCRALQQIYENQSQESEGREEEELLEQELEKLPSTRGFGPLRACDINL